MISESDWESSLLRILDEYGLVSTGPRTRGSWHQDVKAIMRRETQDPRGWATVDWETGASPDRMMENPASPFTSEGLENVEHDLHPVTREAAARQLVAMIDEWFSPENIPDYPKRQQSFFRDAETLLDRFGNDADYYSSSPRARDNPDPESFSGSTPFTDLTMDLGLVVVSPSEVGVFWRFNAI
ncbi:hypothetical protein [Streptomyces qinglanensis]|uniref:hypothetical protein n=1 Tax=Streptomyces qinglanensis TaxID=943816 RepID=UPI003D70B89D